MYLNEESSPAIVPGNRGPGAASPGPPQPRGHPHLRKTRASVGAAAVAVMAAAGVIGLVLSTTGPAGAATKPAWAMTAGNVQRMSLQDAATTSHFFDTPASYGIGGSLVKTPVQAGYDTTPVLSYTSYDEFSSDIHSGNITYPYKWVMYDPENWASTPVNEQQDPVRYMRLFGQLAHANGLKVIQAPSRDIAYVVGAVFPRTPGETADHWYVRANIAGAAAGAGDIYVLQDEGNIDDLAEYASLYNSTAPQARAANPGVKVYSEVSTSNGTPAEMATAAKSIHPDGFYVAAPGAIPQAVQFFQQMKTAGY